MKKTKKEINKSDLYIAPTDAYYWIYLGEKYYRRLQPIPYRTNRVNIKALKNNLNIK